MVSLNSKQLDITFVTRHALEVFRNLMLVLDKICFDLLRYGSHGVDCCVTQAKYSM